MTQSGGRYPVIDAADPAAFRQEFAEMERRGAIDSEGGSEWRTTLSLAMCRHLGIAASEDTIFWLREVLWYAQSVGDGRLHRG